MKAYFDKWTWKRLIQLAVGAFFLWKYQQGGDSLALMFGILMAVQAVLNIGCFSSRGCSTPTNNHPDSNKSIDEIDVDYEEID
jgi:hypothetical protein